MEDLNHYVEVYKKYLKKGDVREAYAGLVKYVTRLGTFLAKRLPGSYTFGNVFPGYMDYTYFYYTNDFLKSKKLKMGLVLNHTEMRFEIWLLGQTIPIQEQYWEYFKTTRWNKGRTTKPQYAILETVIIEKPDFNNLGLLSEKIGNKVELITEEVIRDIQTSKLA